MKKLLLILLSITFFTACENEPIDSDSSGNDDGGENSDLTMSVYELDTKINIVFFGVPVETITNSDFNISNNKIISGINAFSANGSPFETENQTITYNSSDQITSDISVNSQGVTTNETLIAYTDGVISQISYDYFEDDDDDYVYNLSFNENTITRTEVGSNISTVFTLDGSNRVIKKESFDGTFSIQVETITYNSDGNITGSITTGEIESNTTYVFDNNTNPLKVVFEANYLMNFLADDYSDEIGAQIAQSLSTNNWSGAIFNGEVFNFDLEYNATGRITNRNITYDFDSDLAFEFNEKFAYVN